MRKILFIILAVCIIIPNSSVAFDWGKPKVNSVFTTKIENKKPVDEIKSVKAGESVSFFTEIINMEGETIRHIWTQDGEELFSTNFKIGGNTWRVWTTKNIYDWNAGDIQVMAVDTEGNILVQKTINVAE